MKSVLSAAIKSATDLLFPPRCVHCGADGDLFCDACEVASTRLSPKDTCRTCAMPSATSVCEACFAVPRSLDRAIAVFTYEPAMRDAITALKYRDIRAIGPRLGALATGGLPASVAEKANAIVPVPLSNGRLRSRGYNQSELLARGVHEATGIQLRPDLLRRIRDSQAQAKSASIEERSANVHDAFESHGDASGLDVLLIDDVMTTGATLNACASTLKSAGASSVTALVLCREL